MFNWLRSKWMESRLGKTGTYVKVRGSDIYYETYGEGEPLLMFHGGLSTLQTFRKQIPELSKHYQVILPERPGNGHTADSEGAFHYKEMSEDMVAFMKELRLWPSKVIGYSDGANLIFHMALDHPEMIERMVLIGGNFHFNATTPEFEEELRNLPEGGISEENPIDERYVQFSPDGPEHYPIVFEKTRKLWQTEPTFTKEEISKIQVPGLVIAGDQDMVKQQHNVDMYEALLPKAELLIVSNSTHGVPKERPEIVNPAILRFLKRDFEENCYPHESGDPGV